ncbi:MAG: ribosome maturation factor RimM [Acidobacteriota bacterium]
MAEAGWDALVVVARVARPHGLRGEVVLHSETDFPDERFRPGAQVLMQDAGALRTLTIRAARFYKGHPIVGFEGLESIEDVEPLAGCELRIEPADLVALPPGCFYHHDLVGCRVETVEGDEVGTVTRVEGAGGASRLTVDGPAGEQLVPLVDQICRQIDLGARRIVIAAPEGLLGLNRVRGPRKVWRGGRR